MKGRKRRRGEITSAQVRCLMAVVEVFERDGRATVRSVMRHLDLRSSQTVHHHLTALRDFGLVTWEPGRRGTLRPTVGRVEFGITAPEGR